MYFRSTERSRKPEIKESTKAVLVCDYANGERVNKRVVFTLMFFSLQVGVHVRI